MNTMTNEMFLAIFEPVLISIAIAAIFFAFGIHSIIRYNLNVAGICSYLIATGIMYVGLFKMEIALIDIDMIDTRIHLTELLTAFYLGFLVYILIKTRRNN